MYELLPYFFLALAGRRLPMLAGGRVGFDNNLPTVYNNWACKQTQAQDRAPLPLQIVPAVSARPGEPPALTFVPTQSDPITATVHQVRDLAAFKGRLKKGQIFLTGRWKPVLDAFSCVKQSKQDVILPHLCFMYADEKSGKIWKYREAWPESSLS